MHDADSLGWRHALRSSATVSGPEVWAHAGRAARSRVGLIRPPEERDRGPGVARVVNPRVWLGLVSPLQLACLHSPTIPTLRALAVDPSPKKHVLMLTCRNVCGASGSFVGDSGASCPQCTAVLHDYAIESKTV
jgi:hypothetical protein